MAEWYKPAAAVEAETLESKERRVRREAHRRITEEWPEWAQVNALRGVYGDEAKDEMESWVDSHRQAVEDLLTREDLIDIDVTEDEWWPEVADESD